MYYITNYKDSFGFKIPDIHTITAEDKCISDEIYSRFFEEQTKGKSLRIKDIDGTTFEENFEEYQPVNETLNEQQISETDELRQRITQLEAIVETLLKDKQT